MKLVIGAYLSKKKRKKKLVIRAWKVFMVTNLGKKDKNFFESIVLSKRQVCYLLSCILLPILPKFCFIEKNSI